MCLINVTDPIDSLGQVVVPKGMKAAQIPHY